VHDLRVMWAFEVRVKGLFRFAIGLTILSNSATHTFADEIIFLGGAFEFTNGTQGQTITRLEEFTKTPRGATGFVRHNEKMGSFDIVFEVDCDATKIVVQVNLPTAPLSDSYIALFPHMEGMLVTFPDGLRTSTEQRAGLPLTQDVAGQRFRDYSGEGRSDEPLPDVIEYETNRIIWQHADRLRFISELLIARACVPVGQAD
jgi:hypothetical protein